jgi:effector-binding domain-containing protein
MKATEPKLDDRSEQHYMGIRTQVTMQQMGSGLIPQLLDEVFGWLGDQGVAPAGPPLIRYYVINMEGNLDIELGVPVASALSGNGRIAPGVIPAGRYASLVYTGVENGIAGNGVLIGWAAANGIAWDRWDDANGDAFRSRVEYFLTSPDEEPNQAKWETEVAIKVAD